ncbi:hypothetical protein BGX34_002099 [Mortierella sp. NVP85]|nr:hypothetical protein BGX34_002099 [Mortierella sp. NVP85]
MILTFNPSCIFLVDTNSDGEYVDTLDYKPSEYNSGNGSSSFVEDPLQIRDKHGDIRICFHCNKSAYGGRMMISCEHCPLHWHLDCLSPPLASRPPSTRKWMCPNHADHVMPRRRKRRDTVPVQVDDPFLPNDGDIEIMEDPSPPSKVSRAKSTLINEPSGAIFRIPEMSIKLGFLAKCHRSQQQQSDPNSKTALEDGRSHNLDILVAAMMACQGSEAGLRMKGENKMEDEKPKTKEDNEGQSQLSRRSTRAQKRKEEMNNVSNIGVSYEMVQDAVLTKLSDPEERAAYSRFRALQRVVHENGFEASVQQWGEVQMRLEQGKEQEEPLDQPQHQNHSSTAAYVAC